MNLNSRIRAGSLLLATIAVTGGCTDAGAPQEQAAEPQEAAAPAEPSSSQSHFDAGRLAAEPDFGGLASLCDAMPPEVTAELVIGNAGRRPPPAPLPATRVFDKLLFVGNRGISAWALETSEGIILIDALASGDMAAADIEAGLVELGLDPADLKILIISHGHGDHYGGAEYLLGKYDMQVIMGDPDWQALKNPEDRINSPGWFEVPTPDRTIKGRETVTLGDTSIELLVTPSHTLGTMASLFAVQDGAATHKVVLWGGTGFNFGPYPEKLEAYAASAEAMRLEVLRENYDVLLSNHANRDLAHEKIALLEQRAQDDPHPFVLSPERVAQGFEVFRECALGHAAALVADGA